jgi:hypothetical protein
MTTHFYNRYKEAFYFAVLRALGRRWEGTCSKRVNLWGYVL